MASLKVLHLTTVPSTLLFLRGQAAFMRRHGVELVAISSPLASEVLFVSPSIRRVALEEGLCDPGAAVVLGQGSVNGVDARGYFDPARYPDQRCAVRLQYGIPSDALVIGFVGRLVQDKG